MYNFGRFDAFIVKPTIMPDFARNLLHYKTRPGLLPFLRRWPALEDHLYCCDVYIMLENIKCLMSKCCPKAYHTSTLEVYG